MHPGLSFSIQWRLPRFNGDEPITPSRVLRKIGLMEKAQKHKQKVLSDHPENQRVKK